MNELKLAVRKIFEESNGFSRVSVNGEVFKAIAGYKPELPYTTARSANGKGVRIFTVCGTQIFTIYEGNNKSAIVLKSEDAKKHLKTIEQERMEGVQLPFAFA